MRKLLKTKKDLEIFIVVIVVLFLGVTLISNIINERKFLAKIVDNAKVEVEKSLISNGLAVYTKDLENDVGEIYSEKSAYNQDLPKNTNENQQNVGTIVAPEENWNIETVTAISVGDGETVPLPIGFYYVGGDLNTGVIISDEEVDKYDGATDKTTWEYATSLKGNQFVWIPCKEEEYIKGEVWNGTTQTPTTLANSAWDKTTYSSELPQIRKYGGFYVARYEAGLAEAIPEFTTTQQHTVSNQVYNKAGIPQSKAGVIPWMFIDWTTSQTNAKNMYNTNSVSSGLITGTQWEVMLKKIIEKTDLTEKDLTNSGNWGNYINNSIEYKGRLARAWVSSNSWYLGVFGEETEGTTSSYSSNNGDLLTTGAGRQTEKYHIFDVAGNLWEWIEESSLYKAGTAGEMNVQYRIACGGGYINPYVSNSVCYRDGGNSVSDTILNVGFRVVLYLK